MVSFEQVVDEEVDEGQTVPVIYEDNDDSEEEDSEALDTDQNGEYEEELNLMMSVIVKNVSIWCASNHVR